MPTFLHKLAQFPKRRVLDLRWAGYKASSGFDQRIPPPSLNYNQPLSYSLKEYIDLFKRNVCLHQFPELLKLSPNSRQPDFTLLDYGCGLGPLAYAFTNYFQKSAYYIGYEVHPQALAFLKDAYGAYPNVTFLGEPVLVSESYVEVGEDVKGGGDGRIRSQDVRVSPLLQRKVDLQWSHSVFTHMHRQSIINVLRDFSGILKPDGLCVNTWLAIDEFAAYALSCKLADRALPYEVDGFLTYSKENPLVCSAYRLHAIQEIYAAAGHTIVSILWGSWSGRGNGLTYQDVVISTPGRP